MRTLFIWLLLGALVSAQEDWSRKLRALLVVTPTGTTPVPVVDQVEEEEVPGAAVPS